MDEIVFARESLRRCLLETAEQLENAAADYDPEVDFPVEDVVAVFATTALEKPVSEYARAIAFRIKSRTPSNS